MNNSWLMAFGIAFVLAGSVHAAERCVWRDEFNGTKLDTRYWTIEENFIRNVAAVQIYTARPRNVQVKGGALLLTSYHEHFESTAWKPESPHWWESRKSAEYTSGSVNSKGKFGFKYGRVEIRARWQYGHGVWPALWLIGNRAGGWPTCGEIDIMEFVSQNPNTVHATLHWQADGQYKHPTAQGTSEKLDNKWHLYGMNWTPEKLEITFDKKVIFTQMLDGTCDSKGASAYRDSTFYFILNQALGGDWCEAAKPEDYPRTFAIDYVRVYQDTSVKESVLELPPKPVPAAPAARKPRRAPRPKAPAAKTPPPAQ